MSGLAASQSAILCFVIKNFFLVVCLISRCIFESQFCERHETGSKCQTKRGATRAHLDLLDFTVSLMYTFVCRCKREMSFLSSSRSWTLDRIFEEFVLKSLKKLRHCVNSIQWNRYKKDTSNQIALQFTLTTPDEQRASSWQRAKGNWPSHLSQRSSRGDL